MINFNNKTYRNLEEQVLENQKQIQQLLQMKLPGLNIVGTISDMENLPDADTYEGNVGDCYLVGSSLPYDLYIFRNSGGSNTWIYLGQFPAPGPRGLAGLQGRQGVQGDSSTWYAGITFPTTSLRAGDMFLDINTCQVYRYNGGQWISQTNIKGDAGTDGQNGNSIQSIEHQHQQDKTVVTIKTTKGGTVIFNIPDGKPGAGFHVAHIWPEDDADIPSTLPADIVDTLDELWPASEADPSEAILVKTSTEGDFIFVILTEDGVQTWDEAGQIESVQGPAGDPGDRIMDTEDIVKEAAGAQYPNTYKLYINSIPYQTTAPTANNTNGLKIVVLDTEPDTYYDGYYYIITEA